MSRRLEQVDRLDMVLLSMLTASIVNLLISNLGLKIVFSCLAFFLALARALAKNFGVTL